IAVTSRSGGALRLAYPGIETATVTDACGKTVAVSSDHPGGIRFDTTKGDVYKVVIYRDIIR
ncbi:MAG: hypothetical protein ACNA77_11465, partial [Opitutales bacterium]